MSIVTLTLLSLAALALIILAVTYLAVRDEGRQEYSDNMPGLKREKTPS